jgi:CHAT domain-containing protein
VTSRLEAADTPRAEIQTLAERFPYNARAYGEEVLLPRWAAAVATGDELTARKSLALAAAIGQTIARARGEHLLDDAVATALRTIRIGSPEHRQALVNGLKNFGIGVALWHDQKLESAKAPLRIAVRDLALMDHPLRHWATFYLAVCEYFGNASLGLAMFNDISKLAEDRYPVLVGRAEWMAGTADKVQGRTQSSVYRYERAAACLRRGGGDPAAAFVWVLLAESYTLLGEHSLAWENRKRAFQTVPWSEDPRRNVAMWTEAKEALLRQDHLELAGPLVDEAVAYSEIDRKPLARATAYLDRAAYQLKIQNRKGALNDLRTAQTAIAQMEPSALRDQMIYLALITEGLCNRGTRPAQAADLLRRGLAGQRSTGTQFDAITYTTALADAELAAGDLDKGAKSLEDAIAIFEGIRSTVEDPVSRMQAFRQAQPAFDRLIALQTTVLKSDPEDAFRLAERSRARVLLDKIAAKSGDIRQSEFVRLAELRAGLPDGIALASYVVLDHRILVWVIDNGQIRDIAVTAQRADLENAINEFRLQLRYGDSVAAIQRSAIPLYDLLIRPLQLSPNSRSLVVVPDRSLARLPFAALFDRTGSRYLIQQRAVTVTPSATLWWRASQSAISRTQKELSALVMGVPISASYRGVFLPFLPRAEQEAASVAAVYRNSSLLNNAQATREKFLSLSLSQDVMHFAGHAVVDVEAPRRSVLMFADATGAALDALSLEELFKHRVGAPELVVLSACRAQDSASDDREGVLGITGAFVAAGVQQVVASPLDVDDESSSRIMAEFHRQYIIHRSAAVAWRETVLMLLRAGGDSSSPAAWGGFTVIEGFRANGGAYEN